MNRLSSSVGACFTCFSQLVFPLSEDELLTSRQLILRSYVSDGAVQPLRIVDRYEVPHNALRILQ